MYNYRLAFLGLLLCSCAGWGQPVVGHAGGQPKYTVATGEYQSFILRNETGRLYGMGANLLLLATGDKEGEAGLPLAVAIPSELRVIAVASGLHNSVAVDNNGEVWTWGDNGNGQSGNGTTDNATDLFPHKIARDSAGRPFKQVVQVVCWANGSGEGCVALKSDGTVWIWGKTGGGFRGNGQYGQMNTRPVSIDIPGHKKIVKVVAAEILLALASDGTVWSWGGDNRPFLTGTSGADFRRPAQVMLSQPAKDIAGASYISYALGANGKLYGWGYAGAYLGIGNGGYASNVQVALPRDLSADLGLPHAVVAVMTNSVSTHVILADSTLWGWGDNATGAVGNGEELDFAKHIPPYAWDFGPAQLLVQKPVHLAPEVHNFIRVFGGSAYVFYSFAETATGQLYSWGRNKGGVLGNGIMGASAEIEAVYPNSWDVPAVTAVDPFALTSSVLSTSPYCLLHPEGSPCNGFPVPPNRRPVASAGADQDIKLPAAGVMLDGTASHDTNGRIVYYKWSKVSGPAGSRILSPGSVKTALGGLKPGVYSFSLKVTDNGWAEDSATIRINVSKP